MTSKEKKININYCEYLKFIEARLKRTDFRAEQKLKRIDELTSVVMEARKNYSKKSKDENIQ